MKIMDTTIKGIEQSKEYQDAIAYNEGLRAAKDILEQHSEISTDIKLELTSLECARLHRAQEKALKKMDYIES